MAKAKGALLTRQASVNKQHGYEHKHAFSVWFPGLFAFVSSPAFGGGCASVYFSVGGVSSLLGFPLG